MLAKLSKIYEIIVFTSSHEAYANAILNYIDKESRWVHHRLFRENCAAFSGNIYVKDLRVLGRDLHKVIIVDNAAYAFGLQLENGYPIIPFYDSKDDDEIRTLTDYLLSIYNVPDIRVENKRRFKLKTLVELDIGKFIKYYQPKDSEGTNEFSIETLKSESDEDPHINSKIKSSLNGLQEEMEKLYKQ